MSDRTERIEWMVESDDTEDEFGTNEAEAREWLAYCASQPDWSPAILRRRTVVVETSDWEDA